MKTRYFLLAAVVGAAFALRFNMAVKAFFSTFDTSTVGVMALRILREGERPLFYYGQDYMGSLEAWTAAPFIALFGANTTALSLAPTLYALFWVAAVYLLFAEGFGAAGGLAAALSAAACGWYTLWFTMASYGGYPETLLFGTLFLWLVARISFREADSRKRLAAAAGAGLLAALGIWTNYQVFSFLAAGAVIGAAAALLDKDRRRLLVPFAVIAAAATAGFLPLAAARLGEYGTDQYAGSASLDLAENARMFALAMGRHFSWPEEAFPGLRAAALLACAAALILGAAALKAAVTKRRAAAVPIVFIAVFPALFLMHPKAATGATRYTIPLMSMAAALFFAAAVSAPRGPRRTAAWSAVAVWTLFNVLSAVVTAEAKRDEAAALREARREIAAAAEDLGLRHVEIVGSEIDGLGGQTLTFFAGGRVRFTAILNERHLPSAEAADADGASGLLCKKEHFTKVGRSLAAAGFSFSHREAAGRVILYDMVPPPGAYLSVPPEEMRAAVGATGPAPALTDRVEETGIAYARDESRPPFVIDVTLDRPRNVSGFSFHSRLRAGAAGKFTVGASLDGDSYESIGGFEQELPAAAASGGVLFMRAYNPVEVRFAPRQMKHLRIHVAPAPGRRLAWQLGELFVYEDAGDRQASGNDAEMLRDALRKRNVDFCAVNPILGARLKDRGGPETFRRFNERYPVTQKDRGLVLRQGLAVVVGEAFASEAAGLLAEALAAGLTLREERVGRYHLFTFAGKPSYGPARLVFNDMTLLKRNPLPGGGR